MITFSNIELLRGGLPLLYRTSCSIHPQDKVGLVGHNGCGKSSLFSILKGDLSLDGGDISIPSNWQIASVAQETPALARSALDYVMDGDKEYRHLERLLDQARLADDGEKIAAILNQIEVIDGYSLPARTAELLYGLGFSQQQLTWSLTEFSGGWRMRLNLAQALVCRSDLLLLDEPTNHLDLDAVIWLENWLRNYAGTLILISHDRDFIDPIVNRIVHIDQRKLNEYTGNYSLFEQQRSQKLMQLNAAHIKQQKQISHIQSYIDRFRYKASKAKQAQSRLKLLSKMEQALPAQMHSSFQFSFNPPQSLPNPVIQIEDAAIGYEDKLILRQIRFNLVPGNRIGLLGDNGAGKSTFMKLLAGAHPPSSGEVRVSQGVKVGYFAQHQLEVLDEKATPLIELRRIAARETEQNLRDHLGRFGFSGDKVFSEIAAFSGGEKARLVLALIVWQSPNLLLLDEPTNHLDLEMRQALTLALQTFEGAMVVISHDRYLLRATTDELYQVGNYQVVPYGSSLEDYFKEVATRKKAALDISTSEMPLKLDKLTQNRKAQRQYQARQRQKTAPLRKKQHQLELEIDKLNVVLSNIEHDLTDNSLYDAVNKNKLNKLLEQQQSSKRRLEDFELEWLSVQEALDMLETEQLA